jgi:uncharacterized metal-binding protein
MQYKTHSIFNIFLALPFLILTLVHFFNPSIAMLFTFSICFIYSTLYMNPDLDLANKIKLFSLRGILTLPFRRYSLIFHHRGISHFFILGTITRILYLGFLYYILIFLLDKPLFDKKALLLIFKNNYFQYGFLAIIVADLFHLILDLKFKKF